MSGEPLVFSVGGVQLIVTLSTLAVGGVLPVEPEPVVPVEVLPPGVVLADVVLPVDVPLPPDVL